MTPLAQLLSIASHGDATVEVPSSIVGIKKRQNIGDNIRASWLRYAARHAAREWFAA